MLAGRDYRLSIPLKNQDPIIIIINIILIYRHSTVPRRRLVQQCLILRACQQGGGITGYEGRAGNATWAECFKATGSQREAKRRDDVSKEQGFLSEGKRCEA